MIKKQVNAFLKVMEKDTTLSKIRGAHIDEYNGRTVLVATNRHVLAAMYIDIDKSYIGKTIRREAIEVWYKLASTRSELNGEAIAELADNKANLMEGYPDWKKALPKNSGEPQERMVINAELAKSLQDLSGEPHLDLKLYGNISPMIAHTEQGMFILMPIKA